VALARAVITVDENGQPKGFSIAGIDLSQWARDVRVGYAIGGKGPNVPIVTVDLVAVTETLVVPRKRDEEE